MSTTIRRPSGCAPGSISGTGTVRACGHAEHVGTCPECQRAQLGRWAEQLRQAENARFIYEVRIAHQTSSRPGGQFHEQLRRGRAVRPSRLA